jgi:hypothetical protein
MNNKLFSVTFAAAALASATAAFAYVDKPQSGDVTIEFSEPESYTDFKITPFGGESQRNYLERRMREEIGVAVNRYLPAGYQLALRITDVDMAGAFLPELGPDADNIRVLRAIDPPRVKVEYVLADESGNVITSGEDTVSDVGYTFTVRRPNESEVSRESELVGKLVRRISREAKI